MLPAISWHLLSRVCGVVITLEAGERTDKALYPGPEPWRTHCSLRSRAESHMRYLSLKQSRKLLTEAVKKKMHGWWLQKSNMQLIFLFSLMTDIKALCQSGWNVHNKTVKTANICSEKTLQLNWHIVGSHTFRSEWSWRKWWGCFYHSERLMDNSQVPSENYLEMTPNRCTEDKNKENKQMENDSKGTQMTKTWSIEKNLSICILKAES